MDDQDKNLTSSALLEQLVYIDTFVNSNGSGSGDLTPNFNVDSQLSLDLAAFADDSFIFPDEDKPKNDSDQEDSDLNNMNLNMNMNLGINLDERFGPIKEEQQRGFIDGFRDDRKTHNLSGIHNKNGHNNHNSISSINIEKIDLTVNPDVSNLPKFPVPPGAKNSLVSAGLSTNQIDLISALVAQHQNLLGNSVPENASANSSPVPFTTPQIPSQVYFNSNGNGNGNDNQNFGDMFLSNLLNEQMPQLTNSTSSFSSAALSPNLNQNLSPSYSDETFTNNSTGGQTPTNASEYDKRRRNTAASARFRIKKKIKEQQMESKISQLNSVIKDYELKIQQFDMENKLLRNLIIEKGTRKSEDELQALKEKAKRN